jgi:PAS domain S-box-containing protein
MSDAFLALDTDWRVTYANREAARLNGVEAEALTGADHWARWPETVGTELEATYRRAMRERQPAALLQQYPASGRWHEIRLFPMDEGGLAIFYRDVTDQKRVEAERARHAAALVAAMAAAQAASDAKSQFLANTSHEIRTPLNAVMGYAELLEMGLAGPLSSSQQHYLARIQETSRHLLSLINDVLDLSRIEAGQMRAAREPGLLRDAVQGALHVIEPQARGRGVSLASACAAAAPLAFEADSERVRQIIVNLLSNAVRFTESGGRVTLSCGTCDQAPPEAEVAHDGPLVYVRVEDTGVGIARTHIDRIWEAFVQVDGARTRKVGGSGLGLTISRHLARLMGGEVTVTSDPGLGSAFTLWLPAGELSRIPAAAAVFPDVGAHAPVELMPRTQETLAAAVETMQHPPTGLEGVAAGLLAETERIIAMYVARLRSDEAIPASRALSDEALQDHSVTYLADLAQGLTVAANDGPDATAMLGDGTAIQRLIAQRHGAQRARLGWTERELRRDYEVLLEEVLGAVRRRVTRGSAPEIERAAELLTMFIRAAERHSLQAFARARAGQEPDAG